MMMYMSMIKLAIYTTDLKRKQLAYLYDQSLDHLTFFRNLQVPIKKFLV